MNELVNALSATKHKKLSVQSRIDILKDDNSDNTLAMILLKIIP